MAAYIALPVSFVVGPIAPVGAVKQLAPKTPALSFSARHTSAAFEQRVAATTIAITNKTTAAATGTAVAVAGNEHATSTSISTIIVGAAAAIATAAIAAAAAFIVTAFRRGDSAAAVALLLLTGGAVLLIGIVTAALLVLSHLTTLGALHLSLAGVVALLVKHNGGTTGALVGEAPVTRELFRIIQPLFFFISSVVLAAKKLALDAANYIVQVCRLREFFCPLSSKMHPLNLAFLFPTLYSFSRYC